MFPRSVCITATEQACDLLHRETNRLILGGGKGANEKKYSETRQLLARKSLSLVLSDRLRSPVQEIITCFDMDETWSGCWISTDQACASLNMETNSLVLLGESEENYSETRSLLEIRFRSFDFMPKNVLTRLCTLCRKRIKLPRSSYVNFRTLCFIN